MKLIVGLGNIGDEYNGTRHNVGFQAIDYICQKYSVILDKKKFNGQYGIFHLYNEKIILLKPLLYMNLSGEVIQKFRDYFDISIEDILIIHDDLDLDLGTIRLRSKGRSGGHNGLKNIEFHLHTNHFKRIKIGISNNKMIDTKNYVLGKFSSYENEKLKKILSIIPNIFDDYMQLSFECLMNKYNHKS